MSRIIQPVVSPRGRLIVLTGATLWLIAAMVLSATPDGATASPSGAVELMAGNVEVIEQVGGTEEFLSWPRAIVSRGQIFVADRGSNRVLRLDENLNAELIIGREGAGPGEFQLPYDVAVDSRGNIFAVDTMLGRINKYAADGSFIRSIAVPNAATVLIDSKDELIVYPGAGDALLQRYSNDLEPGAALFEKRDERMHRMRMGVLMALDGQDRLIVLDQLDSTLTVYNAEMSPVLRWPVDGPGLQESIAAALASKRAKHPDYDGHIPGFQAMALDAGGERLAFAYLIRTPDGSFTRVAWFNIKGEFIGTEDRGNNVYATTVLPDGRLMEGSEEFLQVLTRAPQLNGAVRGN
jgi:hypothetical protein